MNRLLVSMALVAFTGAASANTLCAVNPYSKAEAEQGRVAFDSHCALCHQFSMTGRAPGNYKNETPDINLLSAGDLKFFDNAGGTVPPLIGQKFFGKWDGKTFTEFSTQVSGAANSFPPKDFQTPKSYFLIVAYVLGRNCGQL
jgi:hypothetical protein